MCLDTSYRMLYFRSLTGGYNCPVTPMCMDTRNECDPNILGECRQGSTLGIAILSSACILLISDSIPLFCNRNKNKNKATLYNFILSCITCTIIIILQSPAFQLIAFSVDAQVSTIHISNAISCVLLLPNVAFAFAISSSSTTVALQQTQPLSTLTIIIIEIMGGFVPWSVYTRSHHAWCLVRELIANATTTTRSYQKFCYLLSHSIWHVVALTLIVLTLMQGMCHHSLALRSSFIVVVVLKSIEIMMALKSSYYYTKSNTKTDRCYQCWQLFSFIVIMCATMGPIYSELDFVPFGTVECRVYSLCLFHVILTSASALIAICLYLRHIASQRNCRCSLISKTKGITNGVEREVQIHLMEILQWWHPPVAIQERVMHASNAMEGTAAADVDLNLEAEWECSICLQYKDDAGSETNQSIQELPCRHKYHTKCIQTWFQKKVMCPLCKDNVAESVLECVLLSVGQKRRKNNLNDGNEIELV